jgi:hypothetical protein
LTSTAASGAKSADFVADDDVAGRRRGGARRAAARGARARAEDNVPKTTRRSLDDDAAAVGRDDASVLTAPSKTRGGGRGDDAEDVVGMAFRRSSRDARALEDRGAVDAARR